MEGWDLHPVDNAGDSPTFRNMANEKASYPSDLYFFWLRGPHLSLKKLRKFLESFCSFSLSWQLEESHCVFSISPIFVRKNGYGWVPFSQTYDNDDWWHLTTESIDTDSIDKVRFGQPKLIAKRSLTKKDDTLRANNFTWHCFLGRRGGNLNNAPIYSRSHGHVLVCMRKNYSHFTCTSEQVAALAV